MSPDLRATPVALSVAEVMAQQEVRLADAHAEVLVLRDRLAAMREAAEVAQSVLAEREQQLDAALEFLADLARDWEWEGTGGDQPGVAKAAHELLVREKLYQRAMEEYTRGDPP